MVGGWADEYIDGKLFDALPKANGSKKISALYTTLTEMREGDNFQNLKNVSQEKVKYLLRCFKALLKGHTLDDMILYSASGFYAKVKDAIPFCIQVEMEGELNANGAEAIPEVVRMLTLEPRQPILASACLSKLRHLLTPEQETALDSADSAVVAAGGGTASLVSQALATSTSSTSSSSSGPASVQPPQKRQRASTAAAGKPKSLEGMAKKLL